MGSHQERAPPFKFNHFWLKEMDYIDLVKIVWNMTDMDSNSINMEKINHKVSKLKATTKTWA